MSPVDPDLLLGCLDGAVSPASSKQGVLNVLPNVATVSRNKPAEHGSAALGSGFKPNRPNRTWTSRSLAHVIHPPAVDVLAL